MTHSISLTRASPGEAWFFICGFATLVGWNSVLASGPFFNATLRTPDASKYLNWCFSSVILATMVSVNIKGDEWRWWPRFAVSFLSFSLCLGYIPLVALVVAPASPAAGMLCCVLCTVAMAVADGFSETALYAFADFIEGTASGIRGKLVLAAHLGQAFAGVFTSFIVLVIGYMSEGGNSTTRVSSSHVVATPSKPDHAAEAPWHFLVSAFIILATAWTAYERTAKYDGHRTLSTRGVEATMTMHERFQLLRTIWLELAIIFTNFAVSLTIFPSMLVEIEATTTTQTHLAHWLVFTWNVGDVSGRWIGARAGELVSTRWLRCVLPPFVVARIAMIPFFASMRRGSIVLGDAGVVCASTVLIGMTNGAVAINGLRLAPKVACSLCTNKATRCSEDVYRENANYAAVLALVSGVSTGTALALVV